MEEDAVTQRRSGGGGGKEAEGTNTGGVEEEVGRHDNTWKESREEAPRGPITCSMRWKCTSRRAPLSHHAVANSPDPVTIGRL